MSTALAMRGRPHGYMPGARDSSNGPRAVHAVARSVVGGPVPKSPGRSKEYVRQGSEYIRQVSDVSQASTPWPERDQGTAASGRCIDAAELLRTLHPEAVVAGPVVARPPYRASQSPAGQRVTRSMPEEEVGALDNKGTRSAPVHPGNTRVSSRGSNQVGQLDPVALNNSVGRGRERWTVPSDDRWAVPWPRQAPPRPPSYQPEYSASGPMLGGRVSLHASVVQEANASFRAHMEDSATIVDPYMAGECEGEQWGFFAVYDGHGGRQVPPIAVFIVPAKHKNSLECLVVLMGYT